MPSVFAGAQVHKGGFRADMLTIEIRGESVAGFLIQNIQFSYTQQVTLLYEIGSEFVYYVGGRSQGTASLSRVLGPEALSANLLRVFNDICEPQDIAFKATVGCPGIGNIGEGSAQGRMHYTLQDAVLTTISVSVTAQEVVINEQMSFIFIDLETGDADDQPVEG